MKHNVDEIRNAETEIQNIIYGQFSHDSSYIKSLEILIGVTNSYLANLEKPKVERINLELLKALKNLLSEYTNPAPDFIMRKVRREQAEQAISNADKFGSPADLELRKKVGELMPQKYNKAVMQEWNIGYNKAIDEYTQALASKLNKERLKEIVNKHACYDDGCVDKIVNSILKYLGLNDKEEK
jgi:transcriptional regulator with XRE-family HTH domain